LIPTEWRLVLKAISPERLFQLQEALHMRYPVLTALLERCQNPARDAQIYDLAFIQEQPDAVIARDLGIPRSIVTHVVTAARRYLLDYATAQEESVSTVSSSPTRPTTDMLASLGTVPTDPQPMDVTLGTKTSSEHVDSQLMGLLLGYIPPMEPIYKHLAKHLVHCSQCQAALSTMLEALTKSTVVSPNRQLHPVEGQKLLLRLQNVMQRTEARARRLGTESEIVNNDTEHTVE
jgi:hypothetical protein